MLWTIVQEVDCGPDYAVAWTWVQLTRIAGILLDCVCLNEGFLNEVGYSIVYGTLDKYWWYSFEEEMNLEDCSSRNNCCVFVDDGDRPQFDVIVSACTCEHFAVFGDTQRDNGFWMTGFKRAAKESSQGCPTLWSRR